MANVTVTKSGNSVTVNFGDYGASPDIFAKKRSYDIRDIVEVELEYDDSFIETTMRDAHGVRVWTLTYDNTYSGEEHFIVDTVEGVAPTSQSDLFDKLTALRG